MSRRGWVLFALMSVIWGVPYLFIKVAVEHMSPALLVFLRTGGGALLLLPVAAARGQLRPLLSRWPAVVAYTAAEVAVPWLLLSSAETRLSSSLTGLLVAAVPLVGAVLARLTGDEPRLGATRVAGLVVGIVGVATLLGLDVTGGDGVAVAEVALAVLSYAIGPLIVTRRLSDVPSTGVIAVSLVLSAAVCAPWALTDLPARMPPARAFASIATLAVLCTACAFLLYFALIAEVGAARSMVIAYVNPAVAVLLGVTVLGESFTVGTAIGFPLVLLGSYLATARGRVPSYASSAEVDVAMQATAEGAGR